MPGDASITTTAAPAGRPSTGNGLASFMGGVKKASPSTVRPLCRRNSARSTDVPIFPLDPFGQRVHAFPGEQVGKNPGTPAAHPDRVFLHHLQAGADVRRQIDLVDDQVVRAGDAGTALARDFLALGDVNDV